MPETKASIKHYIGIDPSAASTGVAILTVIPGTILRRSCQIQIKDMVGPQRLHLLCKDFLDFVHNYINGGNAAGICIEAPSFGSTNRADTLGQVRGALNLSCMLHFWPPTIPVEIPPISLKKFFTGNGNAGKDKMITAALQLDWDARNDDEADAAALAELAWALDDNSKILTRKQLEAIAGIKNMQQPKHRPHFDKRGINI